MKTSILLILFRLLAVAICFGFSLNTNAQLVPDFKADTIQGCTPLVIKFRDLTQGNPTSWLWDLGNGITSTEQEPTTFYFDAGKYTIKLTVTNANGTETIVKDQYITLYDPPNVKFQVSDSIGCSPLNVMFTDLSDPVSGTISSRQWDYGDGTFSNLPVSQHTYNVSGNFTVSLKVTNSEGCMQLISKRAFISVLSGVQADFRHTAGFTCNPPTPLQFIDSSIGKNITSYKWDFGDGSFASTKNPLHYYASNGQYSVSLAIRNSVGCSDTIIKQNLIKVGSVKALFSSPDTVCQKVPVTFNNLSTPTPLNVFWNFGDGTSSSVLNPVKTFANAGTYTVKMTSNFGGCKDTSTQVIVVLPEPSATFTTSAQLSTCSLPVTINFNNTAIGVADYLWNFGDGATATSANPAHTYNTPGTFSVTLTLKGTNGCSSKLTKANLVYFGPPSIKKLNGVPYKGCSPYTANLSASITSPEPVITYLWDFGDGTTSALATPIHTYTDSGSYTVSLKVTTVNGCTTSFTMPDAVILSTRPTANFSATPREACAFEKIIFSDSSSGNITSWIWNFGDGGASTQQNPTYNYKDTGFFPVTLIASNNNCADTLQIPDFSYIKPPIAKFSPVFNCNAPSIRQFQDNSIGAENWKWNFGDGDSSLDKSPAHSFAGSGMYNVELEVTNGSCKHKYTEKIWVINENPVIKLSDSAMCKNINVQFLASNIDTSLIISYLWKFGDGNSVTTTKPVASYKYPSSGQFIPKLTITDKNGCMDSVSFPLKLDVLGPTANFALSGGACLNSSVTIKDLSRASNSFPISNWVWNFGDGTIDTTTINPVQHAYQREGMYNVKLIVTDSQGCMDTLVKPGAILITKPIAAFTLADSLNCTKNAVRFADQSYGIKLKYTWNLGDGTIANTKDVVHSYVSQADYSIKLTISDTFGCKDSVVRVDAVKVANVVAKMVISDTSSSCPPFIMSLWNKSQNYSSILWDFNDGSFSNLDSPSHYFNVTGVYKIKLIANGYGNCKDSVVQTITLKGPSGSFKYSPFNICSPGQATFTANTTNKASFIWDFGDGTIMTTPDSTVSHAYINPGKYKPKLLLKDVAGCLVPIIGKDTITIAKVVARIKNVPMLYCDSTSVQFFDSSRATLDLISKSVWSFGDGKKDSTSKNPVHFYSSPGNYHVSLKVFTKNGCTHSDSLMAPLKVVQSPVISIAANRGVCIDDSILFKGTRPRQDTSSVKWLWSFGDGDTAQTQNPPVQYYSTPGIYKINAVATNSSGCSTTLWLPIEVFPRPMVNAGNDTIICLGQSVQLKPNGADYYRWNADSTLSCSTCQSPVARPNDVIAYTVNGTSLHGCKDADTISIKVVKPFQINTSSNDTLCIGESVRLFAEGTDRYSWTPATGLNNASIPDPVAMPNTTTLYQVIASDKQNCFVDTGFVKITVYPKPVFNVLEENITIPVGNSVTLNSTNSSDVNHWRWVPYAGLNCHDCPQPVASPRTNTTYTAYAWNDGGCKAEDKVTITVICNNVNIYIPNTFSPNADGMNDIFYPRGKGIAIVKGFTVFNRWGAVVYQKTNFNINDEQAGWNGTFKGVKVSPDVYVYKMDIVCENNQLFSLKGNITLIL